MKTETTKKRKIVPGDGGEGDRSPSRLIDARIAELNDWRGELLGRIRALIHQADPEVVEEWKWRGVPVWSHAGIVCTGETYKAVVKLTFARLLDEAALKALIREAVRLNTSSIAQRPRAARARA